jgi:nucleotide-binding universal stress UspA family protein
METPHPIKKILAPIAFDHPSVESLDYAVQLAGQLGASVRVLHVYPIPVYSFPEGALVTSAEAATRLSEVAQQRLDDAVNPRQGRGVELSSLLVTGNAWEEIVQVAKREGSDLIIMGTHGRHGLPRAFLGSVAERVLRESTIPVLVVRAS